MQIRFLFDFKDPKIETFGDLNDLINTKNIGYDETSDANGWVSDDAVWYIWETAFSKFTYRMKFDYEQEKWICVYDGAKNGFLKQNLLPPMTNIKVIYLKGSYGTFYVGTTEDMFNAYNETKTNWENKVKNEIPQLEEFAKSQVIQNSQNKVFSKICAYMYDSLINNQKQKGNSV